MAIKLHTREGHNFGKLLWKYTLKVPLVERPQRDREAQLYVVMICHTLWCLFWFQFVIGVLSNIPAIYWLSGGNWTPPTYEMYVKNSGPFPCSLALTFVFISSLSCALGMLGAWMCTVGVHGKWRMRFVVFIFCFLTCGWSIATLKAKDGMWVEIDQRIDEARQNWRRSADFNEGESMLRCYRVEVERLEKLKADLEASERH
jgi:hypothetical protein